MKKYKKKIICILLLMITILTIVNQVEAMTCPTCKGSKLQPGSNITCPTCKGTGEVSSSSSGAPGHTASEIISEGKGFIEIGEQDANSKINPQDLQKLSNTLYMILLSVGIVIAVVVGLVLGIKFIMASVEEKAEIKAMIIPYIIGCIVVFGAFTIWKVVVEILQSM